MDKDPLTPIEPFYGINRSLPILNLIGIIFLWFLGIYTYVIIEGLVPYDFDFYGQTTEYGSSTIFLIVTPVMTLAQIIIQIVSKYRFTMLNKYPYTINLPAFHSNILKIPFEKRGYWVNRYFEVVLVISIVFSMLVGLFFSGIYIGVIEETLPRWFPLVSLSMISIFIGFIIYLFYNLSKQMKKAIE